MITSMSLKVNHQKRSKLPETIGVLLVLAAASGWQYTKFRGGYGIFYYLSPNHGDQILGVASFFLMLLMLWLIWKG